MRMEINNLGWYFGHSRIKVYSMSTFSIVTPAHNEAPNLLLMHNRLTEALKGIDWEWVVVDDNSKDETFDIITALSKKDKRIKGVRLARNAGSHLAIFCGLELASGECMAVMASDLEDPPELLPEMIEKWRNGSKIIWATRKSPPKKSLIYSFFANFFHIFTRKFIGLSGMPKGGADFFLIDGSVAEHVCRFKEKNLSLFALVAWLGMESTSVVYEKQARVHGRSSWTFRKRTKLVLDTLVSFSHLPLRLMSLIGICSVTIGFALGIEILYNVYFGTPPEGFTFLAIIILFLGGSQIVMLGILGEYLWRTLDEARDRPRFLIDKMVGIETKANLKP
jgi:glycosyltransferase involved in cell wall biosynthesis